MWESPIYKIKAKMQDEEKDIFIDVTGSAPNFREPMKQLEGTFEILLEGLNVENTIILDFGAAKLRNTLYLLKKGFTVYSCEFKDLFARSKQAKEFYEECQKYNNFKPLIFPDEFIKLEKKFDVILLINVLNIMPIPKERLCVLYLCRKKIKENGRLLWYTQHGGYSKENTAGLVNDGLVTGKGRGYHMFYRDFSRKDIHSMLESTGFSFNNKFKFPKSGNNQAYVFNSGGEILIDKTLGLSSMLGEGNETKLKSIERYSRWEVEEEDKKSKKITYETKVPKRVMKIEAISILKQYSEVLTNIKPGKRNASKYHELVFNILKLVFEGKLKKPRMEEQIARNTQRVDITFQNQREIGFFKQLSEGYKLVCPNIFIECKNYSEDLSNTEIFQIRSRLNKIRGQFGIIICRKIENKDKLKDRLSDALLKEDYIVILEDTDIIKLINFKLNDQEDEIDDYIEEKFKQLI